MKNRTITGHMDGEIISRPKTLGERHPEMFKKKGSKLKALSKAKK